MCVINGTGIIIDLTMYQQSEAMFMSKCGRGPAYTRLSELHRWPMEVFLLKIKISCRNNLINSSD